MSTSEKTISSQDARKILSSVAYDQGFHFFYTSSIYAGETATSLLTFALDLESVDILSIRYHIDRGDFQKWIRDIIGDEELARRIDKLDTQTSDENLRRQLIEILQRRLSELKPLAESS